MRTIAVTGHMELTPVTETLVAEALREVLGELGGGGLLGVSCLAPGADTLFAEAVLALGGRLAVVLPSAAYREVLAPGEPRARYDRLLAAAEEVTVLPYAEPDVAAYEAANAVLVDLAEVLVAVWDGEPSALGGGTAAAVAEARRAGIPVRVVWPAGARRAGRPPQA
ncbi:hypothetical protein CFP65_0723 [Kitasatospora sp. MMS16-BH015]|uniref:hypothetical protein n=1 Tax=Kitasatospora sp. MMS16-BH015 TaxID=2018025 RepID=UPI000CA2ACB3|nr:hypothetical protein [Kitasatospora sp. MMS16-BH015]AUG75674.1 hypothetical protein CFP65_0723 [Kitasatospora sp. MMS16-BH015]